MNNETELNQLNQYQVVSSYEGERKPAYRMEEGKKWRQYLAAVLCKWRRKLEMRNDLWAALKSRLNLLSHKKAEVSEWEYLKRH